jgi:diphthamide biosynthesis methyltransferase
VAISQDRAAAIAETQQHYIDLYTSNKQKYQQLRENYAFPIKMRSRSGCMTYSPR